MNNLHQLTILSFKKGFTSINRQMQSNASLLGNCNKIINRNPRNLELLRIARKPVGYHLDVQNHEFWYKLTVIKSSKHLDVEVRHFENGSVVSASTKEWALKKQLYRPQDKSAFANVGRVLARRCLQCGILSVYCDIRNYENSQKYSALLKALQNEGISLTESPRYINTQPWHKHKFIKPWEVLE